VGARGGNTSGTYLQNFLKYFLKKILKIVSYEFCKKNRGFLLGEYSGPSS